MEMDPEFHPDHGVTPSADEQKRITARRLARLHHHKLLPGDISKIKYRNKVLIYKIIFCFTSIFFIDIII